MAEPRRGQTGNEKRRAGGALRVPFIRRCRLESESGSAEAFIVNVNSLGAYIARDEIPDIGKRVLLRFNVPGNEREVVIDGMVAWLNPVQEHPVHSLPPGFGLAFRRLGDEARQRIDEIVNEYLTKHAADDE
jgi:uncharacterized protein (TIGR02266 family)